MTVPLFPDRRPAFVVVVSGPSGVGKTVLCDRLRELDPTLVRAITVTTRDPRPGETDGVDYYFWSEDRFEEGVRDGLFLESARVHQHRYGVLEATVEKLLAEGLSPVLNVDIQGGRSVRRLRSNAVLIFLMPPTWAELESRLRGRGTDGERDIQQRLADARVELEAWPEYDYVVINDELEAAAAQIGDILSAERRRAARFR